MKQIFNLKTAYATALILAAASGSLLATQGHAAAKRKPVMANKPAAATAKPAANPAVARAGVTISSEAMVERVVKGADGKSSITLKNPNQTIVVPGDKVVFTLTYQNRGAEPATDFRAVNPMPGSIEFVEAQEDWADVSVDGGVNWGKLVNLKVKDAATAGVVPVERAASPKDVTHVRWIFANPIAVGAKGSVSFRGTVK